MERVTHTWETGSKAPGVGVVVLLAAIAATTLAPGVRAQELTERALVDWMAKLAPEE